MSLIYKMGFENIMQLIKMIIFMIKYRYLLFKVKRNGEYLNKIKYDDWTFDICLTAVSQNGLMIEAITAQKYKFTDVEYEKLCIAAIRQNAHAFKYIIIPSEQVCIEAIAKNEAIYYLYPHQHKHFNYYVQLYILQNTHCTVTLNLDENKLINCDDVIKLFLIAPKRHIIIKKGNITTDIEIH